VEAIFQCRLFKLIFLKQSSRRTLGSGVVKTVDTPLGPDFRQDDSHGELGF